MKLRFLWDAARKDLARRLGDPIALLLWILLPVTIGGLMAMISSQDGGGPRIQLLLVDQDETFLGDFLSGAEDQSTLGGLLEVEAVALEEGRARIEDGEGSALLVLPAGLTEALLEERPATVTLITNPAQRIAPGILREGLELVVEAQFYLQRLIGEPLRELSEGPPTGAEFFTDQRIGELAGEINRRLRGVEDVLFPPALELETEVAGGGEDVPFDFALFFLPGIVLMSLLFIAHGMSEDLWKEKELGTLRRLVSAPQPLTAFLGGKVLAAALLMAAVAFVALVIAVLGFDQAPSALLWGLPWCTLAGTALYVLFSLIQCWATSRRAGSVLTSLVLFPLMMIGGCFFPFEAMPDWMQAVGRWTPNGLAVLHLKDILRGAPEAGALALAALGITVPAALLYLACAARLRGRFLHR